MKSILIAALLVLPALSNADDALTCGASPRELDCATADGNTLVMNTQTNRDDFYDDFDGFLTRHDCQYNVFKVNGVDLGAAALVGSKYVNNLKNPFKISYYGGKKTALVDLFWSVNLSDADMQRTGGVSEVKLFMKNGQTFGYFVKPDAQGNPHYVPVRVVCQ